MAKAGTPLEYRAVRSTGPILRTIDHNEPDRHADIANMLPALLHHSQASAAARAAQFSAVGLTAVVVAVLSFGPKADERVVPALTLPQPGPKSLADSPEVKPLPHIDVPGVANRFGQLGNSPKPEPKPSPTEEPTAETPPTEESVRYLGSLSEPGRFLALLKVNDRQRLLAPGESFEAIRIVEVGADFAIVEDSRGPRRLTKGERQSAAVTYTSASPLGAAPNAFNPRAANGALDAARAASRARAADLNAAGRAGMPPNLNTQAIEAIRGGGEGGGEQQP